MSFEITSSVDLVDVWAEGQASMPPEYRRSAVNIHRALGHRPPPYTDEGWPRGVRLPNGTLVRRSETGALWDVHVVAASILCEDPPVWLLSEASTLLLLGRVEVDETRSP